MKLTCSSLLILVVAIAGCTDQPGTSSPAAGATMDSVSYKKDAAAIMEVIQREYKAYFEKDYATWASCFVHADYLKYWGFWEGYPEKVRHYDKWADVDADKKKRMAGEIKAYWDNERMGMDISDLNVQVRGDVAWVTFRQRSTDHATGEFLGEALETKILEKIVGQWKIAYLNFLYLPLEASE